MLLLEDAGGCVIYKFVNIYFEKWNADSRSDALLKIFLFFIYYLFKLQSCLNIDVSESHLKRFFENFVIIVNFDNLKTFRWWFPLSRILDESDKIVVNFFFIITIIMFIAFFAYLITSWHVFCKQTQSIIRKLKSMLLNS